jgi:hypothetical protein
MRIDRTRLIGLLAAAVVAAAAWTLASAASRAAADDFVLRVNCGGEEYKDVRGNVWKADKEFVAGAFGYVDGQDVDRGEDVKVANTDLQKVFQTERYSLSCYKVTVPAAGKYTVALLFAETYDGISGPDERVFNVSINGKKVLDKFDPTKVAGKTLTAIAKTFVVDAPDKLIKIDFEEDTQSPMINGIVVMSGEGDKVAAAATQGVGKEFTAKKAEKPAKPAEK